MFFVLPLLPAFAALAVSIGEAVNMGAGLIGIGAAVKGSADYRKAKTLQEDAYTRYQSMAARIQQSTKTVQKKLEDFGRLKLETYTGIIKEAAELLSRFKTVTVSSFKDIQVEHLSFFTHELDDLKTSFIKASDILSCLSAGINTAVHGRFPYEDTPPLTQTIGAFGFKKPPISGIPHIPYAALTVAGLSWGISGNMSKTRARAAAARLSCETEKLKPVLTGYKALCDRVDEGGSLIAVLTEKLRAVLGCLQSVPIPVTNETPPETAAYIETAVSLTRALKQVIETDVCGGQKGVCPCMRKMKTKKTNIRGFRTILSIPSPATSHSLSHQSSTPKA
jgi:hypothetical protein